MINLYLFTKVKSIKYLKKYALLLILVMLASCESDDEKPLIVEPDLGISQEIKDLIVFEGDEDAPIVLINTQGGPDTELSTDEVNEISQIFNTTNILTINVHQAQTLNPSMLDGNDITLDQAINFNTESIETL